MQRWWNSLSERVVLSVPRRDVRYLYIVVITRAMTKLDFAGIVWLRGVTAAYGLTWGIGRRGR